MSKAVAEVSKGMLIENFAPTNSMLAKNKQIMPSTCQFLNQQGVLRISTFNPLSGSHLIFIFADHGAHLISAKQHHYSTSAFSLLSFVISL